MGLFSFLFGGRRDKAKASAKQAPPKAGVTDRNVLASSAPLASTEVSPAATAGVVQAKLRLKLVASLSSGDHPAAYQAAKGLADIQLRAGRKNVARTWQQQAERIKAEAGLSV